MTPKENLIRYFKRQEHQPIPKGFRLGHQIPGWVHAIDMPVCERTYDTPGYDVFGVYWDCVPPAPAHPSATHPYVLTDIEEWETQLKVPKVEKFDWEYVRRQGDGINRDELLVAATLCIGPFERTTMLSSFEDCLVNAITEPEAYSSLIGAITDFRIAYIRKLAECFKPDLLVLHDDWGSNIGPIISPELWRETIKPHVKRLYDACHELDILICQHSCGQLGPLLDDIVEMGADIWEGQGDCQPLTQLAEAYRDRILILDSKPEDPDENEDEYGGQQEEERPLKQFQGFVEYPAFLYE